MKRVRLILVLILLAFFVSSNAIGQTASANNTLTMSIPGIALLSTDMVAITLELTTTVAGEQISGGIGSTHVQISSIVAAGLSRKITASATGIPPGTSLAVSAVLPSNGNHGGVMGTGLTNVPLSGSVSEIVTGIGSCFTGTASDDGYLLNYVWNTGAVGDYGTIVELSGGTATVLLTITDDI